MWVGAAPVGVNGDLITGSWYESGVDSQSRFFACANTPCNLYQDGYAYGYVYCSGDPHGLCHGGTFLAAQFGAGNTTRPTGANAVCDGITGDQNAFWHCEYYLHEPQFN
jgi:hypothetical protein